MKLRGFLFLSECRRNLCGSDGVYMYLYVCDAPIGKPAISRKEKCLNFKAGMEVVFCENMTLVTFQGGSKVI